MGKRVDLVTLSVKCQNILAKCLFLIRPLDSRGERSEEACGSVLLKAVKGTDKKISFVILSGSTKKKESESELKMFPPSHNQRGKGQRMGCTEALGPQILHTQRFSRVWTSTIVNYLWRRENNSAPVSEWVQGGTGRQHFIIFNFLSHESYCNWFQYSGGSSQDSIIEKEFDYAMGLGTTSKGYVFMKDRIKAQTHKPIDGTSKKTFANGKLQLYFSFKGTEKLIDWYKHNSLLKENGPKLCIQWISDCYRQQRIVVGKVFHSEACSLCSAKR